MKEEHSNSNNPDTRDGYVEFPQKDNSSIAVNICKHTVSVAEHRHDFYEFALITKGCCIHRYRDTRVPLIPGDVLMIEPHERHDYELQSPIEIINCHFFQEELADRYNAAFEEVRQIAGISYDGKILKKRWNKIMQYMPLRDLPWDKEHATTQANLNKQGVIHLEINERREIEYILHKMIEEQDNPDVGLDFMKKAYLQQILVLFQRIQNKRIEQVSHHNDRRREYIYQVLEYIEEHLAEKLDLKMLAKDAFWSEGYFRTVFKDVTGLSPVDYLNRLRIVKSLEYVRAEKLNFQEAAARVGIYDASYYNRLFKKVMGESPREFKRKMR